MALVRGASDDLQQNLQDEDFDRRIAALENALRSLVSAQSQQGGPTTVQQVIQQAQFFVGEIGAIPLPTDTLLVDPADGHSILQAGDAVALHRNAATGTPADTATAGAAGTSTEAANKDHAHKRTVEVRKNSAGTDFVRRRLNLIEGTNITLTVADDSGNDEVDVTIAAAGAAASWLDFDMVDIDSTVVPQLGGDPANNHEVIALDTGGQTWVLNLPSAAAGMWVWLRRYGNAGGSLNWHPASGDTIEGSSSDRAVANNVSELLIARDNTDWRVFG